MAKNSGGKSSGPSRIKFIMVDAEIVDGDLSAITQAIQNALRPPAPATVKRIAVQGTQTTTSTGAEVEEEVEEVDEEEVIEGTVTQAKAKGPRKPAAAPKALDFDLKADPSFKSFIEGKDVDSHQKKFMVAAVWLQEHRGINRITSNHIYTCYRHVGWSIGIPDWGQPLRDLKARDFLTTPEKGKYEVHHLGLDFVNGLENGAS